MARELDHLKRRISIGYREGRCSGTNALTCGERKGRKGLDRLQGVCFDMDETGQGSATDKLSSPWLVLYEDKDRG